MAVRQLASAYGLHGVLHGVDLEVAAGEVVVSSAPTAPASQRCCAALPAYSRTQER